MGKKRRRHSSQGNPGHSSSTNPSPKQQKKQPKPSKDPEPKQSTEALQEFRKNLPVHAFRRQLVRAILGKADGTSNGKSSDHHKKSSSHDKVVLITAETGSGKSTQIPAYLLTVTPTVGGIAVTQPRRVAAITLAQRVSLENGEARVGKRIGYRVRFDDCTHPHETQLVYLTDGMLLREAMVDPTLLRYNVVFLDESHERSLQTDILLGVVQRARKQRAAKGASPLRVVVMSATLQLETFRTFFGGPAKVNEIAIPGRQFAVQQIYTRQPVEEYIDGACSTVLSIHEHEHAGDVLVFLPGQEEIEDLAALLRYHLEEQDKKREWTGDKVLVFHGREHLGVASQMVGDVLICLLYASLPPEAQMAAFQDKPDGCKRKVVLATNIAETSVTIPDIKFVVDTGKHKCRQVTTTGMESLKIEDVSQAQAAQRAGRAGRVAEGTCFRLYTEEAFRTLDPDSIPEILRVNLAQVILQLKGMGISDPTTFDFVTPPGKQAIVRATKLLYGLKALDRNMDLSDHGKKLAKLPLDPVFGHLLLQSVDYECVKEMLTAVSVLSADNLFYRPNSSGNSSSGGASQKAAAMHRRFASHEGDLPTFLNVYDAWRKEAVYVPPSSGGSKMQKKLIKQRQQQQQQASRKRSSTILSHHDWCQQNFISGRSMVRAHSIREQLQEICQRPPTETSQHNKNNKHSSGGGLGINVASSCGKDQEVFYRAVAAGLYLQVASRVKASSSAVDNGKGSGNVLNSQHMRGAYKTKLGNGTVSIHPSSALFGRNPAPACVVYTELVTTKKTYIRGVTQIREEWLHEVAPEFYHKATT